MEIFGMYLSIPMSFIAASVYSFIVKTVAVKWKSLIAPVQWISILLLIAVLLEILAVISVGPIKLRQTIGQSYDFAHLILFFLALPSLVNIMSLQGRVKLLSKWYIIGMTCAIFGFCIVVQQYFISETLYGIAPMSGPYESPF